MIAAVVGVVLGLLMVVVGGLIPPAPLSCPTCVVFGPAVLHPACYVEVVVQGRTCS